MRTRALSSGAALIFGRTKDPQDLVELAGTVERMEASGDAHGAGVRSGRAQHTYSIPPDAVRQANVGQFWIVQGGGLAQFRALATIRGVPDAATPEPASATVLIVDHDQHDTDASPEPAAAEAEVLTAPAAATPAPSFRPTGLDED